METITYPNTYDNLVLAMERRGFSEEQVSIQYKLVTGIFPRSDNKITLTMRNNICRRLIVARRNQEVSE